MTFSLSSVSGRARPARAGRRALLIATSVALVSGVMLPAAGPATAAPEPSATRDRPVPEVRDHAITLVTGDVVHWTDGVGGQDTVTVDRPEGATGGVHVRQAGEDLYVIPDEASALLAAEKLDRRLFNISTLVEMGYDDRRSGGIPLIATYAAGTGRSLPTAPRGSTKVRTLESVHGMALKAGKDDARAFWNDITRTRKSRSLDGGIAKLWLDGRRPGHRHRRDAPGRQGPRQAVQELRPR